MVDLSFVVEKLLALFITFIMDVDLAGLFSQIRHMKENIHKGPSLLNTNTYKNDLQVS